MLYWILMDALEQGLIYVPMALGVFISFRVLNFPDLSVDGTFPLGAAVTASLIITHGYEPISAMLVGVIFGGLAGVVTGVLNTKLKILHILSGILTMTMLYSINMRVMGRPNIPLMGRVTALRQMRDALNPLFGDYALLIGLILIVIVIKLITDLFFKTETGLSLRATGDNEQMITACGVNTDIMKVIGLALSNALVALSGSLVAQYSGFADVGMGIGMIIAGLASVVVGEGLLPTKSIGWMTGGVIVGSIVYRIAIMLALRYGYTWGFEASDLRLITAFIVIVALAIPQVRSRLNLKRLGKDQKSSSKRVS